jgi:hypothetical protein
MVTDLIITPQNGSVPAIKASTIVAKQRALVTEWLEHAAEPLQTAVACKQQLLEPGFETYLGAPRGLEDARFLDRAVNVLNKLLPKIVKADEASNALQEIVYPGRETITRAMAADMLSVLFGALSKRKADEGDENATMLLMECADMFNPTMDIVGSATGLWKELPKHPVILALAIKRLIAVQKFSPDPRELREAIKLAGEKVASLADYVNGWLALVDEADAIVFKFAHERWSACYGEKANIPIVGVMAARTALDIPRGEALNAIYNMRDDAEQAKSKPAIAACAPPKTKRTRRTE